ncbi:Kelch repeat-containing protein [Ramlibacter albus]|uniref:Fibronectin type-III domain-containing protein n=1 Tax=Ramlibacter albus TaxID=2079448 RepID=A0A923MEH7_9BURK|nr:hypothetical protein [Ramlibacter albus]MBC5768631.1 hypothetical protein [Ramlibacter albus]
MERGSAARCAPLAGWLARLMLAFLLLVPQASAAPPGAPTMTLSTQGTRVSIGWSSVAGATGYWLYYAPYPSASAIGRIDVATLTSVAVDLPPGAAFFVAIRARNADGEGAFSNIGSFVIAGSTPVATTGSMALNAGDYWEFEWSNTTTSGSSSGGTRNSSNGTFRATLGTATNIGGRTAYPLTVTGDPGSYRPIWTYLSSEGSQLLGTRDGATWSTVMGDDGGGWKGAGFFVFFRPDLARTAATGTFTGNYRSTSAWTVSRSASTGGCRFFSEIGDTICVNDPVSYSETEYQKPGVGPIGYRYTASASFSGGGFLSVSNVSNLVELVKSSRTATDGTVFAGSPYTRLPDLTIATLVAGAGSVGGRVLVAGGLGTTTPWVQLYNPATSSWSATSSTGVQVTDIIGASGGRLYALGASSLLVYDTARNNWSTVATAPTLRNPCGAAAVASGKLVLIDCPGTSVMAAYVYDPSTGRQTVGIGYTSTVLRPGVAAVGDDVYVIGGYTQGAISSTVRRFRTSGNFWENLTVRLPTARDEPTAVARGSSIYVMGGTSSSNTAGDGRLVEILDTGSMTFSTGPTMPEPRFGFAATELGGAIYIVGGRDSGQAIRASAWVLQP